MSFMRRNHEHCRLWHISSNRWNSAITEYALSSARSLAKRGFKSTFSPLKGSPAEKRAQEYGLDTRSISSFSITKWKALKGLAQDIRPDIIFTYGGPETSLAQLLSMTSQNKKAVIVRFRGQDVDSSPFLSKWRFGWSHRIVDLVISPSPTLTKKIEQTFLKCPVKTVVLGCDESVFSPAHTKAPLNLSINRPDIIILGRLDPVKGHENAIEFMRGLLKKWPQEIAKKPRLHIIGEPANLSKETLIRWVKQNELCLGDDVILTSERVSNIASYLSKAVFGFIPSTGSEIICRVAHEFLLCGTPIVVSGVGSLDDAISDHAGHGYSYKSLTFDETIDLLVKASLQYITESEDVHRERAAIAKSLFSLEAMGKNLEKCLEEFL